MLKHVSIDTFVPASRCYNIPYAGTDQISIFMLYSCVSFIWHGAHKILTTETAATDSLRI